jgi:hypothetical protein
LALFRQYDRHDIAEILLKVALNTKHLSWLGTSTFIKTIGGAKLPLWEQTFPLSEMVRFCKCFQHSSKMPTLTYLGEHRYYINQITDSVIHCLYALTAFWLGFTMQHLCDISIQTEGGHLVEKW